MSEWCWVDSFIFNSIVTVNNIEKINYCAPIYDGCSKFNAICQTTRCIPFNRYSKRNCGMEKVRN